MTEKQYLSIRQAAKFSSLSARLLYNLCRDRKIRYFKIGGRIVLDFEDIENFIRERTVEPVDWSKFLEKKG